MDLHIERVENATDRQFGGAWVEDIFSLWVCHERIGTHTEINFTKEEAQRLFAMLRDRLE